MEIDRIILVGIVLLLAVPLIGMVWVLAFVQIDDIVFNGCIQAQIRRWNEKKWREIDRKGE